MRLPLGLLMILSLIAAPSLAETNTTRTVPAVPPPPAGQMNAPYDVEFLDTMADHHKGGIKMMEMAVRKASSPQVKSLASRMMDEQQRDLPEFLALRNDFDSGRIPPASNPNFPGMAPMDQQMAKLAAASGTSFDRLFLQTMILHHGGAVTMSEDALRNAINPAVRAKAQQIKDVQQSEIQEMEVLQARMK